MENIVKFYLENTENHDKETQKIISEINAICDDENEKREEFFYHANKLINNGK